MDIVQNLVTTTQTHQGSYTFNYFKFSALRNV